MRNILYLHNSAQLSGGEESLLALWGSLDRSKFMPFLALPVDGPLAVRARALGIETVVLEVPSWRIRHASQIARAWGQLSGWIVDNNIDLVHSYTPRNNMLAALVGKVRAIPVVWHERNLLSDGERDVSRMFSWAADAIICNSRAVASRFSGWQGVPASVRVILNGVDLARFVPPVSSQEARRAMGWEDRRVVGLVSNLNARKNVEFFLEVIARLAPRVPGVLGVVVGGGYGSDGEGRLEVLKAKAEALGISAQLYWAGSRNDVVPLVQAFDVYCAVTEREACSRALMEAMACGKPVVAVNDGGNPEIIGSDGAGVLAALGSADGFAQELFRLLEDPVRAAAMGGAARRRAEELFDVQRNAAATAALYEELC